MLPDFAASDALSRREFLKAGSLTVAMGMASSNRIEAGRPHAQACIQIMLTGGPSQLETWDPKPDAPAKIRGPLGSIATRIPGVRICEHLPRLAQRTDRYAILRSLYHEGAPIHETGQQLLQTGHLITGDQERPHFGAAVANLQPSRSDLPSWVILPGPIQDTAGRVSHGQGFGFLAKPDTPADSKVNPQTMRAANIDRESPATRALYGSHSLGENCLRARRLVEQGARVITINMFDTVFGEVTWDCHANGSDLKSTLQDYRNTLCPMLDQALSALLDELAERGMLDSTLVVCAGEFGRTPRLNNRGGRDHWPGVWSGLIAGGGVRGGQIIGASDSHAAEPKDRPIHLPELTASIYQALGLSPTTIFRHDEGRLIKLVDAEPVAELF